MNQLATLNRRLYLLRLVEKPFRYPSKESLVEKLQTHVPAISERTLERDIRDIYNELGLTIRFCRRHKGYYLDRPADEDPADFDQLLQLLERREWFRFLTSIVRETPHPSRLLQLEQAPPFAGNEHLPVLWDALRQNRCVRFNYRKFADDTHGPSRLVEPALLFEYRNRWYLDAYDLDSAAPRTYGLDRMAELETTNQTIAPVTRPSVNRQHVIGVTAPEGAQPERVVLRFTAAEANYPRTLPLHTSQRLVQQTPDFVDYELTVVLNPELEREILAFGDYVEVLEPAHLRTQIARRIQALTERYSKSEKN